MSGATNKNRRIARRNVDVKLIIPLGMWLRLFFIRENMAAYFIDTSATADAGAADRVPLIRFGGPLMQACVAPSRGAELCSLKVLRGGAGGTWVETIHRANDYTATEGDNWAGKSPTLWPAVGRNFTAAQLAAATESGKRPAMCKYHTTEGGDEELEIPLHGFAQNAVWRQQAEGTRAEPDAATVVLECSPEDAPETSKAQYPFEWLLQIQLRVAGDKLSVRFIVENKDAARRMPFSVGTHPTFRLPTAEHANAYLTGTHALDLKLSPFSCLTGDSVDHTQRGKLPALEFCDNVMGRSPAVDAGEGCFMELVRPDSGMTVRLSQKLGALGKQYGDAPLYFVMWADKAQGFFCLEPWCGGPNSLNEDCVRLAPGAKFDWLHEFQVIFT